LVLPSSGNHRGPRGAESVGLAQLAGISGAGGLTVAPDGTHGIWPDYEIN
jgi:hypothetical protein